MGRESLDSLLAEIGALREQTLRELDDVTEAEFGLSTATRPWKWDTLLRVLLQLGNHLREHSTQIEGTRQALGLPPTQPQRILAQAEIARGNLLAAVVGLTDADLDTAPPNGGWPIRRILEHVRDSEAGYLEAARLARAQTGPVERVTGGGPTG